MVSEGWPAPMLTRWSLGAQSGPQSQDLKDEQVSYQGAGRAHLSRGSQEAWFTLRMEQNMGWAAPCQNTVWTPHHHAPGAAPPNGDGITSWEQAERSWIHPVPPLPRSTHHRAKDPSKTLRPHTSRGPSSPHWTRPPWGPIRTWLPLKWTQAREGPESEGSCLLTPAKKHLGSGGSRCTEWS